MKLHIAIGVTVAAALAIIGWFIVNQPVGFDKADSDNEMLDEQATTTNEDTSTQAESSVVPESTTAPANSAAAQAEISATADAFMETAQSEAALGVAADESGLVDDLNDNLSADETLYE